MAQQARARPWQVGLALALSVACVRAQPAMPLQMHYQERPPYSATGTSGEPVGLLIEPLKRALQRAGIAHAWVRTPSQRQLVLVQQGPLPILSLVGDYELVADEPAAQAALRTPGNGLRTRPLLFERPACELEPPGDYWIESPVPERNETAFDVDCARRTLLLIAFPVAGDLDRRGRILVDGEPVRVLRANVLFHAICMPPGRHRLSLRPVFGGD